MIAGVLVALAIAAPASAEELRVFVNGITGDVVVADNAPESDDWLRRQTVERVPEGWVKIHAEKRPGWGAISCSRHDNGQYDFQISTGDRSEADARRFALAASEKHLSRSEIPGKVLPDCGLAWNDTNQPIAVGGATHPAKSSTGASRSGSVASTQVTKRTTGSGKLSATPIDAFANPILVNRDKVLVPLSVPGYQEGRMSARQAPAPAPSAQAGQARLRCRLPSDELDPNPYPKCDEKDVDASQGRTLPTPGGNGPAPVRSPPPGSFLHLEVVTACEFVPPWSKQNQWRCQGPAAVAYVSFDKPDWLQQLRSAGGRSSVYPRDLGLIGRFRVFGWGFPLGSHPDRSNDVALKMGVPEIPTRLRYWCPKGKSTGCTLQ